MLVLWGVDHIHTKSVNWLCDYRGPPLSPSLSLSSILDIIITCNAHHFLIILYSHTYVHIMQARQASTSEIVAIKKMNFSGKQSADVSTKKTLPCTKYHTCNIKPRSLTVGFLISKLWRKYSFQWGDFPAWFASSEALVCISPAVCVLTGCGSLTSPDTDVHSHPVVGVKWC